MPAYRSFLFVFSFLALIVAQVVSANAADPREKSWGDLKQEFFENVEIADGSSVLTIDAPTRAHDAAVVPIKITAAPGAKFKRLVLFVDENPIPMAADFSFGKGSPSATFSTRVRVNSYSYVRAVAEGDDGGGVAEGDDGDGDSAGEASRYHVPTVGSSPSLTYGLYFSESSSNSARGLSRPGPASSLSSKMIS